MKIRFFLLFFALIISGCDELAPVDGKRTVQTTAERLKPSAENTFTQLMDKSAHNVNYILYGLLNYDEVKIKRGTDNMRKICRLITQKLPDDYIDDEEEQERWKDIYQQQSDIAENINFRFEEFRYADARGGLMKLMKNCMSCHGEITGISKAELTFVGKRNPNMDMALTEVMDSNNLNFGDALFSLVAQDLDELETALNNMKRAGSMMMAKIPSQLESHKDKWDTYCKAQRDIVIELSEVVKKDQPDEIWSTVEKLLKNCMDCHKLYKPGIK